MATRHKRASEVTLASIEEKSSFQLFVERTWKPAALAAVVLTAAILLIQAQREHSTEARLADWDALASEVQLGSIGSVAIGLPGGREMTDLAATFEGATPAPTAALLAVKAYLADEDAAGARAALDRLRSTAPDHPYVTEKHSFVPGSPPLTAVEFLERKIDELEAWREGRDRLYANPPLPADAPRVRITTSKGDIVVGLYSDRAPAHAANFLALCQEGTYVGTKIHRVQPGSLIEGGDPNSREGDPATWGQGGLENKLDPEPAEDLHHFAGVLSAPKAPASVTHSSGSLFAITVEPNFGLDNWQTIFGLVLEGADVAKAISESALAPDSQRPEEPVEITAVVVLD